MTGGRAVLTALHHSWEVGVVSVLGDSRQVHVVRRCADLAELLSTAEAGLADRAVVGADLPGLDRAVVLRLADLGIGVVGLHEAQDADGARDLRRWGVAAVLPADTALADLEAALLRDSLDPLPLGAASAPAADPAPAPRAGSTTAVEPPGGASDADPAPTGPDPPGAAPGPDRTGRVIAVWGPTGAPGRTTVALHVATELAHGGLATLLVDADTYGASIAQALGLLDEAPGLVAAARAADNGTLDRHGLAALAPVVLPGLRVLTGLPRAERWTEVREHALADILEIARGLVAVVVVDVGFCLEQDEELFFDTRAPRRHGLALRTLREADVVVAVGGADPLGVQRLVRGLDALRASTPVTPVVVLNRVRSGAVGGQARARLTDALHRFAQVERPVLVPDDRAALDAAGLAGRSLTESHPRSPARTALRRLALDLTGTPAPAREQARRLPAVVLGRRRAR